MRWFSGVVAALLLVLGMMLGAPTESSAVPGLRYTHVVVPVSAEAFRTSESEAR